MNTRRGSVLIAALLFAVVAAGIAYVIVADSIDANQTRIREENYADALSAAEYGAELAASEIARAILRNPEEPALWVRGDEDNPALFSMNGVTDPDQRRIAGFFNDHEFRVRVRSAKLAQESGTMPEGWLFDPAGQDSPFRDVYEITSTARPRAMTEQGTFNAAEYSAPVVQTLVAYPTSLFDSLQDGGATVMLERIQDGMNGSDPSLLTAMTEVANADALMVLTGSGPGLEHETRPVYSINISGEDHNLITESEPDVVASQKITTPLRLASIEAHEIGASGGYWLEGDLTLNFINIDDKNPEDAKKYKNDARIAGRTVKVPVPNPQRPYTLNHAPTSSSIPAATIPQDRAMVAKYSDRTVDSYFLGGRGNGTTGSGRAPKSVLADPLFPLRTIESEDTYKAAGFITGLVDSNHFNIVLGSFEDLPKLYINVADGAADAKDPTKWQQVYIGQYTRAKFGTKGDRDSMPVLGRYVFNTATLQNKVRPQTIHMVLNEQVETKADGTEEIVTRMLVRAHEADVPVLYDPVTRQLQQRTFYFASPGTSGSLHFWGDPSTGEIASGSAAPATGWVDCGTISWSAEWKGRYMWVRTKFVRYDIGSGSSNEGHTKFVVDERELVTVKSTRGGQRVLATLNTKMPGEVCVPRIFFWQELLGYSLEKDSGGDRAGEPSLIDDGLGTHHGTSNPDSSSLRTHPREVNGMPVKIGFDETFQQNPMFYPNGAVSNPPATLVDANDPIIVVVDANKPAQREEVKYSMDGGGDRAKGFLFEKTFLMDSEEQEQREVSREAVGIFIAYEDDPRGDFNYHDMFFTVFVSPRATDVIIEDVADVSAKTNRWWEQDEAVGLTGNISHPALGVNMLPGFRERAPEALRKEHFGRFKYTQGADSGEASLIDNVWTMQWAYSVAGSGAKQRSRALD